MTDSAGHTPSTLLDLFQSIPGHHTAVIVPEQNIRITYSGLRNQVEAAAEALSTAGVVGAVVEIGERLGVRMPATRAVYACTKLLYEHRTEHPTTVAVEEVAR